MTSTILHILAMLFMLLDHIWATKTNVPIIFTCVGRLAFPIFAFMITQGFKHTSNIKKYIRRILLFALISEIPFNLMVSGSVIYPFHQNVLWTFLISLVCMYIIETMKDKCSRLIYGLIVLLTIIIGYLLGYLGMVDYLGEGILMVLVFYFFAKKKWYNLIIQFILLFYINTQMLGGFYFEFFGFEILLQGLALFSLVFIWLYNGKQGVKSRWFQYFCYAFYPLHMIVLALL